MAKIGIFDSGSGGLSVYREIVKLLPAESYVYVADSAFCPYGEKSREQVTERACAITEFLIGLGCEIVVVACNTATAAAIATLRNEYGIPFIGMEPAVKIAAISTKSGIVGVLATAGTLKASKYIDTRDRYSQGKRVIESVGQGFVELVENGDLDSDNARETVRRSVMPLIDEGADVLVLGCTHYPFLMDTIRSVTEESAPDREIMIIDPAPAVARHLVEVLKEKGIPFDESGTVPPKPDIELYSSGDLESLRRIYKLI